MTRSLERVRVVSTHTERQKNGKACIIRVYFTEDDIIDGDIVPDAGNVVRDVYENVGASEAASILEREGLSFAATGNDWAADPDGSHIVNYATGLRCETSGHLDGFPERVLNAIIAKVG